MSNHRLEFLANPNAPIGRFSIRLVAPNGTTVAAGTYPGTDRGRIGSDAEHNGLDASDREAVIHVFDSISDENAEDVRRFLEEANTEPNGDDDSLAGTGLGFAQGALDAAGIDVRIADMISNQQVGTTGETPGNTGDAVQSTRSDSPARVSDSETVRSMVAMVENDRFDSDDDLLLKRPDQITESELGRLWKASMRYPDGHPLNRSFADVRTRVFNYVYGPDPAGVDATGRMTPPERAQDLPAAPTSPKDHNGRDVKDAVLRTVRHIADTAGDDTPAALRALQSGLNVLERSRRFADADQTVSQDGPFHPLKTDGVFGPKTLGALKRTVAIDGAPKAREALALGRFTDLVETARRNPDQAAALRPAVEREVGDLFPARCRKAECVAPARALQESLNDLNSGDRETADLEEDGLLGPITERVFLETAARHDPEVMTVAFGRALGLLR